MPIFQQICYRISVMTIIEICSYLSYLSWCPTRRRMDCMKDGLHDLAHPSLGSNAAHPSMLCEISVFHEICVKIKLAKDRNGPTHAVYFQEQKEFLGCWRQTKRRMVWPCPSFLWWQCYVKYVFSIKCV